MNAGCYGSYVADHFVSATAVTRAGEAVTLSHGDMGFAYRSTDLPPDLILTSATFEAPPGDPAQIEAKDGRRRLAKRAATPSRSTIAPAGRPSATRPGIRPPGGMTTCMTSRPGN